MVVTLLGGEMYGDVKNSGDNVRGCILWGQNVRGRNIPGRNVRGRNYGDVTYGDVTTGT